MLVFQNSVYEKCYNLFGKLQYYTFGNMKIVEYIQN